MNNNKITQKAMPPGYFISEEMTKRGWKQTDLAAILGKPVSVVSEIIKGSRPISMEMALSLATVFGDDPKTWIQRQTDFQISISPDVDRSVVQRAKLFNLYPIREMQRRGWIVNTFNASLLEADLRKFLERDDIYDFPVIAHAARKSGQYTEPTPEEKTWLARAKYIANSIYLENKYSDKMFNALLEQLAPLKINSQDVFRIPRLLRNYGIRFVIVEPLPKTKIDGACLWLDKNSPVIAMSLRVDRNDNFWFTLGHELGHLKNHDGETVDTALFDGEYDPENKPELELRADEFSQNFIVDQNNFKDWVSRNYPYFRLYNIMAFAMVNNVHPGLVVGQLHYHKKLDPSHGRKFLEKIRNLIIDSVPDTDGWGHSIKLA